MPCVWIGAEHRSATPSSPCGGSKQPQGHACVQTRQGFLLSQAAVGRAREPERRRDVTPDGPDDRKDLRPTPLVERTRTALYQAHYND